ncbi:MAG: Crp/Fnr family transcriptional regulator [Gammaproteobacteria bacterium]|jgi:CRP-like cAMP-binding protein|nr:Crp/Fnr family transcriptional regulator [Gammaproteobacteria bacterium]
MLEPDARSLASDLMQTFPLFERLPDDIAGKLAVGHAYRPLERGATVMAQGERSPALFCILDGMVKLVVPGGRQKERIIDIVGAGSCFCLASVFLNLPCPVTAVVLEPGRALTLKRDSVLEAAASHPALALRMLGRISWQLFQKIREAEADTTTSSAQRIVNWLLSHNRGAGGASTIAFDHNKKTTAAALNVTPETFSRVLRYLRDLGLIDVGRHEITIIDATQLASVRLNVFAGRPPIAEEKVAAREVDAVQWLADWPEGAEVPPWFSGNADGEIDA